MEYWKNYWFFWMLFPISGALLPLEKDGNIIRWLLAGLFLGPIGLLVAILPEVDMPEINEEQIKNVEYHIKQRRRLREITRVLKLREKEVEMACSQLVRENKITRGEFIRLFGHDNLEIQCSYCREDVKQPAAICRKCGNVLV